MRYHVYGRFELMWPRPRLLAFHVHTPSCMCRLPDNFVREMPLFNPQLQSHNRDSHSILTQFGLESQKKTERSIWSG